MSAIQSVKDAEAKANLQTLEKMEEEEDEQGEDIQEEEDLSGKEEEYSFQPGETKQLQHVGSTRSLPRDYITTTRPSQTPVRHLGHSGRHWCRFCGSDISNGLSIRPGGYNRGPPAKRLRPMGGTLRAVPRKGLQRENSSA